MSSNNETTDDFDLETLKHFPKRAPTVYGARPVVEFNTLRSPEIESEIMAGRLVADPDALAERTAEYIAERTAEDEPLLDGARVLFAHHHYYHRQGFLEWAVEVVRKIFKR